MNLFHEAAVLVSEHKQTRNTKHKLNMRYPNTSEHSNRDRAGYLMRVLMGKYSKLALALLAQTRLISV